MTPAGVRWIRKRMGLRQEDLAKLMAVSRSAVIRWESGEVEIPESMARFLRLLYQERQRADLEHQRPVKATRKGRGRN